MLQHLDTNEGVESVFEVCWDVAVVHQVYTHAAFQAGSLDPFFGEGFLFNR